MSTAGRGKLSWGLVQNQCRNYFLVLEKKACFEIVLLLQLFPPLITVDLKKRQIIADSGKTEQNLIIWQWSETILPNNQGRVSFISLTY